MTLLVWEKIPVTNQTCLHWAHVSFTYLLLLFWQSCLIGWLWGLRPRSLRKSFSWKLANIWGRVRLSKGKPISSDFYFHMTHASVFFLMVRFFFKRIVSLVYNCFTVLISAVQLHESAVCIRVSPSPWASISPPPPVPPFSVITEPWAWLAVWYSSFLPAVYFAHGMVYVSIRLSQFTHPLLSPLCPQVHICVSIPALGLCF